MIQPPMIKANMNICALLPISNHRKPAIARVNNTRLIKIGLTPWRMALAIVFGSAKLGLLATGVSLMICTLSRTYAAVIPYCARICPALLAGLRSIPNSSMHPSMAESA
jgi:hypothetical protein